MFGRYELQALVGRGGMGEVYRAELNGPAGFRKAVAVKVLRPGTRATADDLFKEARLGALLQHPNVVGTYELGIEEDIWLEAIKNFRRQYGSFAGSEKILRSCAHTHGQSWYKGVG